MKTYYHNVKSDQDPHLYGHMDSKGDLWYEKDAERFKKFPLPAGAEIVGAVYVSMDDMGMDLRGDLYQEHIKKFQSDLVKCARKYFGLTN